jgi:hypothetical protein
VVVGLVLYVLFVVGKIGAGLFSKISTRWGMMNFVFVLLLLLVLTFSLGILLVVSFPMSTIILVRLVVLWILNLFIVGVLIWKKGGLL